MAQEYTVVVVGAGISGLAAAAQLAGADVEVVCLEARARVGGRLLSVPAAGGALDLGSTWFWPDEARVARLVQTLGVAVHSQHTAGDALEDRPQGRRRMAGNPLDAPAFRYTQGAQSVAIALAATLPAGVIRLGAAVSAIESDSTGMVVHFPGGQVRAAHVVLAVPPALAVRTMAFHPALADRVLGLARHTPVWMGDTTKVVAQYLEPFWRDEGLAGAAFSATGPLRELHDLSGSGGQPAALFGFASSSTTPEVVESAVVQQLVRLYGPRAASPLRIWIQDWSKEAHTSHSDVGTLNVYQLFGHPLYATPAMGGRLHWATTETAPDHAGHVEGALAGAERAAGAVLAALS